MAVETATYISDLNSSNPTGTDLKSEGDNHIRLVKSAVKATFPNVTGAVTPTHTQFNYLAGATGTTGTTTTNLVFSTSPTIATPTFSGLITANGGQIKFPAAQSASADPNTLDDYEEGTFTPTLQFGGAATGMTYSVQSGIYTKVGRVVHFRVSIRLSAKGSSTGQALITGMPFTSAAGSGFVAFAVVTDALASITASVFAYMADGSATITMSQGFTSLSTLQHSNFSDTSLFVACGSYIV